MYCTVQKKIAEKMKKVFNLVKKRKSSLGTQNHSPSRVSLDQVSSSVGIESASAASMVYQSTPNLHSSSPVGKIAMNTSKNAVFPNTISLIR